MRAKAVIASARAVAGLATAVALTASLAACSGAPDPAPTSQHPSASVIATPSIAPTPTPPPPPTLHPDGTAQENLAFFNLVNTSLLKSNPKAKGKDFINALVTAGFDKKAMQVTPDITTIGLVAQSIQFSVKIGEQCLIGQNGSQTGYRSEIAPALHSGSCLIGDTRPINW